MKGATLFSGIACPELAMPFVDWLWCAEVDAFASAVFAARYPDTPNLGDVTDATFIERARRFGPIELLVFGSPCQSFSVAGQRGGLADPRGNLALIALGIVSALRPRWFVFENVPGLLSSESGRDFATFLETVEECRYFGAWGTLDAQWFGVPQRRRRVFFVGHSGDWRYPVAVLSECFSLSGHPAPSRAAREEIAHPVTASAGKRGYGDGTEGPQYVAEPAMCLNSKNNRLDGESQTFVASVAAPVTGNRYADHESRESLLIHHGAMVRRLTPRECERLQGLPDDWTQVKYRGKPAKDGPRYKAIGNGMAVPVLAYLGQRITRVDAIAALQEAS